MLIDTSVLIAVERGRFDLSKLLAFDPPEEWFIAAITVSELLAGVYGASSERREKRLAHVEQTIAGCNVVDFDEAVARSHAAMMADLRRRGENIGYNDGLIAATALRYNHEVAAFDRQSFPRVPGLKLIDLGAV